VSILYDNGGEFLQRTASVLDYNAAYTVCLWAYVTNTSLGTFPAFFSVNIATGDGTSGYDYLATTENGDYLSIGSQAGETTDAGGVQFTNGTWVHVALVRPDTTQLLGYVNGALRITASGSATGGRGAAGSMSVAKFYDVYSQLGGRTFALKIWQEALTAAQIAQEMHTILPRHWGSLWGWWPMLPGSGERTRDYGGNGRTWTENGTLSDTDHPPVSWGAGPITAGTVVSGGGGSPATVFTMTLLGVGL
jgi:hypothetical protein